MDKVIIGIDQSYKDTGITITINNKPVCITNCYTENLKTNSEKRNALQTKLIYMLNKLISKGYNTNITCIIERIRLQSQGFININYIKSIGALNALIVDLMSEYGIPVYSVDTRAWKSSIVGTSKGRKNKFGINENKWPTILWCIRNGYEGKIKQFVSDKKSKGVIAKDGERYTYNDNIADSICISLYGFIPFNQQKLQREH